MSWREVLPVHPAADLFPRMSADELRDLADDIKKNGLKKKVDLVRLPGRNKVAVLDGINRLDALELLGRRISLEVGGSIIGEVHRLSDAEAAAFVISANIKRRHLVQGQKRELIARVLALAPEQSDRQIAKTVGVHHETVGSVRTDLEGRGGFRHADTRVDSLGRRQPAKKIRPRDADNIGADRLKVAWEKVSDGARVLFMRRMGLVYADPDHAEEKTDGAGPQPAMR